MAFRLHRFKTLDDFNARNAINEVIFVEGGYVNNKDDRGGETKFGITKTTAEAYRKLWGDHEFNGDMYKLPESLAYAIYRYAYWDRCKCDELAAIHPLLAFHVFDLAVNGGTGLVAKQLQRALSALNRKGVDYPDLVVDGAIGPGTIRALNKYAQRNGERGVRNLIYLLVMMQGDFYVEISEKRPNNETFTNGWIDRAASKMALFAQFI